MEKKSNNKRLFENPVVVILSLFLVVVLIIVCSVFAKQLDANAADAVDTEVVEDETNIKNQSEHSVHHEIRNYDEAFDGYTQSYVYDYVDPETRVHYLIIRDTYYNSGRGGITVRYNSDGTIMVDDIEDTNGDASE